MEEQIYNVAIERYGIRFVNRHYRVEKANLARVNDSEYPIRIKFDVCDWVELERPARFGMAKWAFRGVCKTREEFFSHCKEHSI